MGHIQPIGAAAEKIEGFFDTCQDLGMTGKQGVIIPRANVGDLMLRPDVVEACAEKRFHVYAVETVQEALELLTGISAGTRDADGQYPDNTLLGLALLRAFEYWFKAAQSPESVLAAEALQDELDALNGNPDEDDTPPVGA